MDKGFLSPIQKKVLKVLATLNVSWRLSGGGALIGAYTHHRMTRDLDLFFLESELGEIPKRVMYLLNQEGFVSTVIQKENHFVRINTTSDKETVLIDLVAENISPSEPPRPWKVDQDTTIQVDSLHELLVTKLCALLSRSEIRDLVDLQEILKHKIDLSKALQDSAEKDSGFSPLTLAWVLRELPIEALGRTAKLESSQVQGLTQFRNKFVAQLCALCT